jgi:hypothetical protein
MDRMARLVVFQVSLFVASYVGPAMMNQKRADWFTA